MGSRRTMVLAGGLAAAGLGMGLPMCGQSVALEPVGVQPAVKPTVVAGAGRGAVSAPAAKLTPMPVRQISLYKNGVGFVERTAQVTGDELVRINFTTAQLNDVLQSLTAVDLGGGTISGLGYDAQATLQQQLASLSLGLGADPTVADFLRAIKGAHVEVRSGGRVVSGHVMNVEVTSHRDVKTGEVAEQRVLSILSDAGGLRTFELTPAVEVRMLDRAVHEEIGRYLRVLATTHETPVRQLTLEDKGTGKRELQLSYLSAMPAWKSNYRILFTDSKAGTVSGAETATLQGWAVVDNVSGDDWKDVQLTLVSGAPESFTQQISTPKDVARPEMGMQGERVSNGSKVAVGARFDPMAGGVGALVPMSAGAMGSGVEVYVAKTPPGGVAPVQAQTGGAGLANVSYEKAAGNSLAPATTSVALDDLFEYKLAKPITVRAGESAVVPLLQTEIEADRVTVWHANGEKRPMRALWLKNTSELTLDRGSFSILENGMFDGQGQMKLLHPQERQVVPYAADEAVSVRYVNTTHPAAAVRSIAVTKGVMTVHRRNYGQVNYMIENVGTSARNVVIERPIDAGMQLSPETPAAEVTDNLDRFLVAAPANATTKFHVLESHAHPDHYDLAKVKVDELEAIVKESKGNADVVAALQPLIDAKRKLAEFDKKMKEEDKTMNEIAAEEGRIRQNIAVLKGTAEEQALAKRYTDEMNAQEDKLAAVRGERDAVKQQRGVVEKGLEEGIGRMKTDVVLGA
jgi:hypothetical protein